LIFHSIYKNGNYFLGESLPQDCAVLSLQSNFSNKSLFKLNYILQIFGTGFFIQPNAAKSFQQKTSCRKPKEKVSNFLQYIKKLFLNPLRNTLPIIYFTI